MYFYFDNNLCERHYRVYFFDFQVNGKRRYLPVSAHNGNLRIFKSGRLVQVASACGINVNFDGRHAVSVVVPGKYRNAMTGLCGNCNGDRNDDFKTKDGKDKRSDKNRYSLIGDSYSVADPESDQPK